jgi:DNA-directed RNA polymerase sigma subunit (sigma70/sigma32)
MQLDFQRKIVGEAERDNHVVRKKIRKKRVEPFPRATSEESKKIRAQRAEERQAILALREEGKLTLEEIGEMHGLTKQRIGQIVAQALRERAAAAAKGSK